MDQLLRDLNLSKYADDLYDEGVTLPQDLTQVPWSSVEQCVTEIGMRRMEIERLKAWYTKQTQQETCDSAGSSPPPAPPSTGAAEETMEQATEKAEKDASDQEPEEPGKVFMISTAKGTLSALSEDWAVTTPEDNVDQKWQEWYQDSSGHIVSYATREFLFVNDAGRVSSWDDKTKEWEHRRRWTIDGSKIRLVEDGRELKVTQYYDMITQKAVGPGEVNVAEEGDDWIMVEVTNPGTAGPRSDKGRTVLLSDGRMMKKGTDSRYSCSSCGIDVSERGGWGENGKCSHCT